MSPNILQNCVLHYNEDENVGDDAKNAWTRSNLEEKYVHSETHKGMKGKAEWEGQEVRLGDVEVHI